MFQYLELSVCLVGYMVFAKNIKANIKMSASE